MLYHNWQKHGTPPGPPFDAPAPNLLALLTYARANFGGSNLGIYVVRPITGGTSWSTHAYGAANDWGYTDYRAALLYIDFLIAHHEALHVQMIIDENHDRTWKCWRDELGGPGWKTGTGVHGSWLHIETSPEGWADNTPITDRLTPTPAPAPVPVPVPTPEDEDDMTTARLWQHPAYANVWLVGPSTLHLSGKLAASYLAAGIPLIVEAHDQTLKTVLFQCGLTAADLVAV